MKASSKAYLAMTLLLMLSLAMSSTTHGQVLISLLLGDKLNTDKIEFGLVGGINRSYIHDIETANGLNHFNLGFYFHLLVQGDSYLSTGVLVKSNVGARGMNVYETGDPDLDAVFAGGELIKKISYFYVPIMFHQRFDQRVYIEAGIQPGLRSNARDIFKNANEAGDIDFTRDVRDTYKRLDFGLIGGIGYKLKKQVKSMAIGVNYYYGLVNVSKVPETTIKNSSIYLYFKVPIGVGKKTEQDT